MTTPIIDFVRAYCARGTSRFHMPGHKGRAYLGAEPLDITEVAGADVLYNASGIIDESEANATALFGSAHSFYSTEGSTLAIKAMLFLAATDAPREERPLIFAGRNTHKAFLYGCALLEEIYIPDGITVIGEEAFFECTSLFNILHLSNTLITVERGAFLATGITSLYLPDGVTTIGNSAFYGTALAEVSIPASVTIVDDSAFDCCYGLSRVEYRGTKAEWLAVRRGAWWITAPSYTVVCEDGELIKG